MSDTHTLHVDRCTLCVCVSSTPSGTLRVCFLSLSVDPRTSMGGFWAAWALLVAVAPGPFKPEARYGFLSGNVSSIPDFPVTLDGTSRAVFRLDEICSSNCAPRVEGFNFSPPSAAATTAPAAHGLSDVSQHASPSVRDPLVVVLDRFVPLSGQIPPLWGTSVDNLEHNLSRFSSPSLARYLGHGPGPPEPNGVRPPAPAADPSFPLYRGRLPVGPASSDHPLRYPLRASYDPHEHLWAQLYLFYALQLSRRRARTVPSVYRCAYGTLSDAALDFEACLPPVRDHPSARALARADHRNTLAHARHQRLQRAAGDFAISRIARALTTLHCLFTPALAAMLRVHLVFLSALSPPLWSLKRPDITYNPISPFIDEDDFNRSDGLHTFSDASWSSPNPMGGHVSCMRMALSLGLPALSKSHVIRLPKPKLRPALPP